MLLKRSFPLMIMLGLFLILATACGPEKQAANTGTPATPPGERLYILDGSATTTQGNTIQHIVTIQPGNSSSHTTLPAGLFSQDHKRIYTAVAQNQQTTITITNSQTAATINSFTIAGTFSTAENYYTDALLSPDGHWLALRQMGQSKSASTIALVDTTAGKIVKTIQLNGNFELDALSPDGNRIYLIEQLNDQPGHYHVRLYEMDKGQLNDYNVVDKRDVESVMVGNPLTRQTAADGKKIYTLYTNTEENKAFIHILPVANDYIGARCIDLPAAPQGVSADLLRQYTLALSSDGKTLYAANAALGVVTAISVSDPASVNDDIIHTEHFQPTKASSDGTASLLYNGAVLSSDESTLYFIGKQGIWAVDTTHLAVKRSYVTGKTFTGIALSSDGRTLYAVHPTQGVLLIDVASGQQQQIAQSAAHTPLGIAWVDG